MIKIRIIVLSMMIIGFGFQADQVFAAGDGDGNKETTVIKIEGMSCSFCSKLAKETMTSTEGVESVKLDINTGLATVTYDKQSTNPELIASTVEKETYFESEVVSGESKEDK